VLSEQTAGISAILLKLSVVAVLSREKNAVIFSVLLRLLYVQISSSVLCSQVSSAPPPPRL
jgi:mRNA-degrading endonuclease toxin of MazEF toxin-antitoxin module